MNSNIIYSYTITAGDLGRLLLNKITDAVYDNANHNIVCNVLYANQDFINMLCQHATTLDNTLEGLETLVLDGIKLTVVVDNDLKSYTFKLGRLSID